MSSPVLPHVIPHRPRGIRFFPRSHHLALAVLALALIPIPAHAQGCTQCRDNTAATSPATQRAYRHAIILMGSAAAAFFLSALIIFKRNP